MEDNVESLEKDGMESVLLVKTYRQPHTISPPLGEARTKPTSESSSSVKTLSSLVGRKRRGGWDGIWNEIEIEDESLASPP